MSTPYEYINKHSMKTFENILGKITKEELEFYNYSVTHAWSILSKWCKPDHQSCSTCLYNCEQLFGLINDYEPLDNLDYIYYTAKIGHIEGLKFLLTYNKENTSHLYKALEGAVHHIDIIQYLVSRGAIVDTNVLNIAISEDYLEAINYLMQFCNYDKTILKTAIKTGSIKILKLIINYYKFDDYEYGYIMSAKYGKLHLLKYFTELGVDTANVNNKALKKASKNHHTDVVNYLVGVGADINIMLEYYI